MNKNLLSYKARKESNFLIKLFFLLGEFSPIWLIRYVDKKTLKDFEKSMVEYMEEYNKLE